MVAKYAVPSGVMFVSIKAGCTGFDGRRRALAARATCAAEQRPCGPPRFHHVQADMDESYYRIHSAAGPLARGQAPTASVGRVTVRCAVRLLSTRRKG